jgi:hypothetical protein
MTKLATYGKKIDVSADCMRPHVCEPSVQRTSMAKQPEEMVIRILQQIQATLADHGRMHEEHPQAFDRIERRLDETLNTSITAIRLASHANVRHGSVEEEIADLKKRVERLEEKL